MDDIHDVALTALFLDDETVVMQQRDEHAPTAPNQLAFFGGAMSVDEDALQAAARELREEISLDFDIKKLTHVIDYPRPQNNGIMHLYMLNIDHDEFEVYEGKGRVTAKLADLLSDENVAHGSQIASIYLYRMKHKEVV